ncbi:MAG: bifunctional ADP-dependent NAD(P)H-hydrate dehydratase/NAD(P)H-hydrate epimerase, partial [Ruminococcus sp.]|nr:bifunctional ADP-dependent NAD(P)H-hydrate dehydratase/NAD(P)H-hydrate epimerase [Ruminococcus sp.]
NSGMATGGSGDVLAGIAGALLAQGAEAFDAAAAAVYLHGKAGDIAAEKLGKISMLPTDIINCIPAALKEIF